MVLCVELKGNGQGGSCRMSKEGGIPGAQAAAKAMAVLRCVAEEPATAMGKAWLAYHSI